LVGFEKEDELLQVRFFVPRYLLVAKEKADQNVRSPAFCPLQLLPPSLPQNHFGDKIVSFFLPNDIFHELCVLADIIQNIQDQRLSESLLLFIGFFLLDDWLALAFFLDDRLPTHVDLAFQELVELLHHLSLGAADREFTGCDSDSVRLAARLLKVIFIVIGAAASPASVHQSLIVLNTHLGRGDSPLTVAWLGLLVLAVATALAFPLIGVTHAQIHQDLSI